MAGEEATHVLANQGTHIAEMLLANPLNLNELGFNKYPVLPLKHLPAPRVREIYEKMVDDIFSVVSMTRQDFPQCWDRCVTQLESRNVLLATAFTEFEGYHAIKDACLRALQLPRKGEQVPCLPAPIMVSLIVSLNYRKIAPAKPDSSILDMLGEHGSMVWLKVAIQIFATTGQNPFLVMQDNSVNSPTTELSHGIWTVKATMQPPHRYLAVVHRELPILRVAPPPDRRLSRDAGDPVYTATLTITREQALTRIGELLRQLRDASVDRKSFKPQMELLMDFYTFLERIQTFEGVLAQDINQISWEHRLPGERIEMQDSDLSGPSLAVLADAFNQLPEESLERALGIEALNNMKNFLDYQQRFRDEYTKLMEEALQIR
ncbi:hypothetical protein FPCIR_6791 [Fusarium pseudocircinatum]|uniref:Uncharacterized protein n=1 Tax=Fusarium pseudocircinatum TaxID=56676 RepID=A0A8H5P6B1_9HYPO|nr:hypothetical protein FPCIR_6791 [Fusarium pseudocircinatum]